MYVRTDRMLLALTSVFMFFTSLASPKAEVLGPCGTADANKPVKMAAAQEQASGAVGGDKISRVPLPGEKALNFELAAVVGDTVKNVKLSDYDGKWRVVCFYPADFTFV